MITGPIGSKDPDYQHAYVDVDEWLSRIRMLGTSEDT